MQPAITTMRRLALFTVLAALAAGCGQAAVEQSVLVSAAPSTSAIAATTPTDDVETVSVCDPKEKPEADAALYRDEPVYEDGEAIVMKVEPFAGAMEGFETLWWDPRHNGWLHVGFMGVDIAEKQRELEAEFPNEGVVAVELFYNDAQLRGMARELDALLPEGMGVRGTSEMHGVVSVWVGKLTHDNIEALSRAAADFPVCADGCDWYQCADPGPQQSEGDGWRYLVEVNAWIGFEPLVLSDDANLARIWDELGIEEAVPSVDWETEIVIAFEVADARDCFEQRFDGIRVDGDLLHAAIVNLDLLDNALDEHAMCDLSYTALTYLTAVDRSLLPAPPFRIKAAPDYAAETIVVVDLRTSGAAAPPELAIRRGPGL